MLLRCSRDVLMLGLTLNWEWLRSLEHFWDHKLFILLSSIKIFFVLKARRRAAALQILSSLKLVTAPTSDPCDKVWSFVKHPPNPIGGSRILWIVPYYNQWTLGHSLVQWNPPSSFQCCYIRQEIYWQHIIQNNRTLTLIIIGFLKGELFQSLFKEIRPVIIMSLTV